MARTSARNLAGAGVLLEPGVIDEIRLTWRLMRDERVPVGKYLIPLLVALYVVSPIDSIPDFLFGVGQLDDLGAVVIGALMAMRLTRWFASDDVVTGHLRAMGKAQRNGSASSDSAASRTVDAGYTIHS